MHVAQHVLAALGAKQVLKVDDYEDPTTEEEFKKLQYESDVEITWEQYQQLYPEIENKIGLKQLRFNRDILLQKTDWIMTVDSFQTLQNKEEWVAYRKALRDLPENPPPFKWNGMLLDIEKMDMPVKPAIIRSN